MLQAAASSIILFFFIIYFIFPDFSTFRLFLLTFSN
ncbi:Uncharacterised protein [Segatella copri]|nr:Uncharacterised protein [Segatella copri]